MLRYIDAALRITSWERGGTRADWGMYGMVYAGYERLFDSRTFVLGADWEDIPAGHSLQAKQTKHTKKNKKAQSQCRWLIFARWRSPKILLTLPWGKILVSSLVF